MKDFVLDTNVILHDSRAIFLFEENNVLIPMTVVEELDTFKKEMNELGRNARFFSKTIDELRAQGSVAEGVLVNTKGGMLRVVMCNAEMLTHLPPEMDHNLPDNRILAVALHNQTHSENKTVLVSKDTNMRIKADALALPAENYENDKVDVEDLYTGILYLDAEDEIPPSEYLLPNQYVVVRDPATGVITKEGRYDQGLGEIVPLREDLASWGLEPANDEQRYLMDLLLNDDIKLVTVSGIAGTGKTVSTLACALRKVTDEFVYRKLLVSRPVMPMGKDIGFLPGPQPLDAKILTPAGWTTMGELKIGSRVITAEGTTAQVLGIYPKGKKAVYKVSTTEGTSAECCEDHLWLTTTSENRKRKKPGSVKSTKQLQQSLLNKFGKLNHHLPRVKEVTYDALELPLAPYTLGVLLGDGSICESISFASKDSDIIERVRSEVEGLNCSITHKDDPDNIQYYIKSNLPNNKPAQLIEIVDGDSGEVTTYRSIGDALEELEIKRGALHHRCLKNMEIDGKSYRFVDSYLRWSNPVKDILHKLGVLGHKAYTKFIPEIYLYRSSISDRIALLQGLMDTDGCVKTNGEATFCTTSAQLASDITTLVRSLGGRAVPRTRNRIGKESVLNGRTVTTRVVSYEFNISLPARINPFHLHRKAERFKCAYMHGIGITDIEYVGEKEVQCILIDHPDHLYVTDSFLVTHNTIDEKLSPYIQPIRDNVEFLVSGSTPNVKLAGKKRGKKSKDEEEKEVGLLGNGYSELEAAGIMEIEPLLYIRGRSIPNVILMVDEAQNLTPHEVKTIVTRAGKGTKVIFTGDHFQIDTPYLDSESNGLSYLIEKFKSQKIAGHITLTKGERSELAEIATQIL